MRPLTDEEMRTFFGILQKCVGSNISKLIERPDEPYTFRLLEIKVWYMSERQI